MKEMTRDEFHEMLLQKGTELYRDMPWRHDTRPYYVLVSELMLQQTQVDRVVPKFEAFIEEFPDVQALAKASLADVLKLWNGLGYNRRAKYLHDAAKMIVADFGGEFPADEESLRKLPGVGPNTAGAIAAYAFNQPAIFVETNVRTVYFHHFFPNGEKVDDRQLREMVAKTIDRENPREFYWSLMDYGTWLKKQGAGRLQQSRHYKKQSALKGSVREVRGQIVKALAANDMSQGALQQSVDFDERFALALGGLMRDGLVVQTDAKLHLTK
jgi:A/G-specific adenine glycosylase